MTKLFFDSNVIVYANDARDARKQKVAIDRITLEMRAGTGVLSTQVLAEYAVVAVDKLAQSPDTVVRQLILLEQFEVVQVTAALIRRALELKRLSQIHFWDAQILAAAEAARCAVILSEDLNPGPLYAGIRVENPFARP